MKGANSGFSHNKEGNNMLSGTRILSGPRQMRATLVAALALALLVARGFTAGWAPGAGPGTGAQPALLRAPLAFEPNLGQNDSGVRFTVRQPAGTIYFT